MLRKAISTVSSASAPLGIIFVALVLLLELASCQDNLNKDEWFILAQHYIKADEAILRNESEKKETFLEDITKRDDIASRLLRVAAPSIEKLNSLLHSTDAKDRKIALVNIMLRKINDNQLVRSIFETYRSEDQMLTKFYSQRCFYYLNESQLEIFEDQFIRLLFSEKDENVITTGIPTLMRLNPAKTRPVFKKYLKGGSKGLRIATIVNLKQMNNGMLAELQNELKSEGVNIWAGLPKEG